VILRRLAGAMSIAVGMSALGLGLFASPVQAEAPSQTGWWFQLQTKTIPAPLPSLPTVPAGGIYVQQGASGPSAYGAVRYAVSGASTATLTLAAAAGSTTSLGAPLQACATSASWKPPTAEPGNWEDRPAFDKPCTPGKISSDGKVVAFFLDAPYFRGGAIDVAIVPVDGAPPFAIAFDKPADDSLTIVPAAGQSSATANPIAPAAGNTSAVIPSGGRSPSAPITPVVKPATPAAPAASAAAPDRSNLATSVLNVAGLGDPDRGERAAALAGASAIVVGWWLLSTRTVRAPALLGALAGGGASAVDAPAGPARTTFLGGVGRFAKERDTASRSLR
jgi:hypothetical protein